VLHSERGHARLRRQGYPELLIRSPSVTNSCVSDSLGHMVREISAGGVVVRRTSAGWHMAVIEPRKEPSKAAPAVARKKTSQKMLLALPKGLVDPGEEPEQTAVREVAEETGITAVPVTKLGDTKYAYVRTWGGRERVFKIVSFYLFRYQSGEIDKIAPDMRIEVKRALWIPLEEASARLAYQGEKDMVRRAQAYLKDHPDF
jgi:8-oxo-dGTP pyrophosphatase MutT (NUDIX family)